MKIGKEVGGAVAKALAVAAVLITAYVIVHAILQAPTRDSVNELQNTTLDSVTSAGPQSDSSRCDNISGFERHYCFISVMEATRDPSICGRIDSEEMRGTCYNYYRFEVNPTGECHKILNEDERINCYSTGGALTENLSLCDKIDVGDLRRDKCYVGNALPFEDHELYGQRSENYTFAERFELCEAVHDPDMGLYCLAALTLNEVHCNNIADEFRNMRCKECVSSLKACLEQKRVYKSLICYFSCELIERKWGTTTRWW